MNKTIKHLVSAMAVAGFLLLAFGSDEEEQEQTNNADTTNLKADTPNLQIEFEKARKQFYKSFQNAPNEIKKSAIIKESSSNICEFESRNGRRFENWTGVLKTITATGIFADDAIITIESRSQGRRITYHAVESGGSTVYNKIAELKEGDNVYFTFRFHAGRFIEECFYYQSQEISHPEFMVSISDIRLYK